MPELVDMTRRFWIGLGADAARVRAGDGRPLDSASHRSSVQQTSNWIQLAARDAGRAVGRLAVLRARLAVAGEPQPEHVHADRHGHRRGVALQRGRDARARHLPGRVPRPRTARWPSTSRRPRSSPSWCCSARCWSCARARARAAPSARCSTSRRRPRGRIAPDGAEEEVRSMTCRSATGCACARARRCRSTARWSRAAARSTSRW